MFRRMYLRVSIYIAALGLVLGCQSAQLGGEVLQDGKLHTRALVVKAVGSSLQMPFFRADGSLHLAGLAGQKYALVLHNRSADKLKVTLLHKAPGTSQLYTQDVVLKPGANVRLRPKAGAKQGPLYQLPSWGSRRSINTALGLIDIHYKTIGKAPRHREKALITFSYGHCEAYQQRGICPLSCPCSSHYNRTLAVYRNDLREANTFRQ